MPGHANGLLPLKNYGATFCVRFASVLRPLLMLLAENGTQKYLEIPKRRRNMTRRRNIS